MINFCLPKVGLRCLFRVRMNPWAGVEAGPYD